MPSANRVFLGASVRQCYPNSGTTHPDAKYYHASSRSGATTGLSAADTFYSFRTAASGTGIFVVTQVRVSISNVVGFASAKPVPTELYVARSFTASDSGGTALTIGTNDGRAQTSDATFGASGVSDIRIASTGTLTAGTRTLDAVPHGTNSQSTSVTANTSIANGTVMISTSSPAMSQLILTANEGFVIQVQQSYPATGTWHFNVSTEWFEVPAY